MLAPQYAGQEFGPKGTGSEDTITEMSKYSIEGLSDGSASDQFGSFGSQKSSISGSFGSVGAAVHTNNVSKLPIITTSTDS